MYRISVQWIESEFDPPAKYESETQCLTLQT
jgi:hypothetical protein